MADTGNPLSSRQLLAIVALLRLRTHEEAARDAGVAPRTLQRWLRDESFNAELGKQRSKLINGTLTILARASAEAAEVLRSIAANPKAHTAARVSAARAILDLTNRFEELSTFGERLAALEALAAERLR